MAKKKYTKQDESQFMAHWQPLLNLVSLINDPRVKKAILKWINENQNCAYTMKSGDCQMDCANCANDITIERVLCTSDTKRKKGV